MANALTGPFDAIVEISIATVNRILATIHQNGESGDDSPGFLHSVRIRVGDTSLKAKLAALAPGILQGPLQDNEKPKQPHKKSIPQGASKESEDAKESLMKNLVTPIPVQGTARVQLSTPIISGTTGSVSKINAHIDVRAHYLPDPNTGALPNPIHGEVRAAFFVIAKPWSQSNLMQVKPSDQDSEIIFTPAQGSGLSSSQTQKISELIRVAVRSRFEPADVEMSGEFKFLGFKTLGTGGTQTLAFPLLLSQSHPSSSAVAGLSNLFLKSSDHFAVAISKQFVESKLQSLKNALDAFEMTIPVEVWVPAGLFPIKITLEYKISVKSVTFTWQNGSIIVTLDGSAVGEDPLPDYNFKITQKLTLALISGSPLQISLKAIDDPVISGLPDQAVNKAKSQIIAQREAALQMAQAPIQQAVSGTGKLDDLLQSFANGTSATYSAIEIKPDGLILHGTINLPSRAPLVVHFQETPDGSGFTAFDSWIPGGTVARYEWSWERENPYFDVPHHHLEGAKLTSIVEDRHGFFLPNPDQLSVDGRLCLKVEGKQIPSVGASPVSVWKEECQVVWPVMRVVLPSAWRLPLAAPVWRRASGNAVLEDQILAHVNAFAHAGTAETARAPGSSTLVHFAGVSARPLETLAGLLQARKHREVPVGIVIVFPIRTFHKKRAPFVKSLGSLGREFTGFIIMTEDYESGWTRTFGIKNNPATVLINSNGEVVWQKEGFADSNLASELDRNTGRFATTRPFPLRMVIRPGDRARDVLLPNRKGELVALRKLFGKRLLLTFWKSWSAPSLNELARLQKENVLAINDGEDSKTASGVCRARGLNVTVISDPNRAISASYGIHCWPTTIAIDPRGTVEHIQFGIM